MRFWVTAAVGALAMQPATALAQHVHQDAGNADSALASCITAVEERRSAAPALAARADTLWRRAESAGPSPASKVGLARALLECRLPLEPDAEGDLFAEAQRHLNAALAADSTYWPARYVLATALALAPMELELTTYAITQLELTLAPGGVPQGRAERADAFLRLGALHLRSGHSDAAAAAWRRGAAEFPADARFRERLGRMGSSR